MSYYNYKVRDTENKTISGLVEAPNVDAAAKLLKDKKYFVVELREARENQSFKAVFAKFRKVKFGDVVNFTRQLSTMVNAGLQLPEALAILRVQTENSIFEAILMDIEHQIVSGGNLADSLAKYPNQFSDIYIALVRAGETSGTLDQVLSRLAENLESQQEFINKVKGAMVYPVIILIAMVGVIMVMMTVVIPKLTEMYKEFGATLPWSTQILMSVSDFFVKFWWLMIILMVVGVTGFVKWRKTVIGEFMVDTITLKIPIIGELQKKMILTEFTRTLSMLVASGIHILDGLKILRGALGNVLFRNAIYEIAQKIEKGYPMGDVFAIYPIFPPIVPQMIKVGEETGKLDETLLKLSVYFKAESEHLVKGLTTAIEPIILIFLAVGVGFIVFSIITPIYNLTSQF